HGRNSDTTRSATHRPNNISAWRRPTDLMGSAAGGGSAAGAGSPAHRTLSSVHGTPSCASQIGRSGYAAATARAVVDAGADRYRMPSKNGPLRANRDGY